MNMPLLEINPQELRFIFEVKKQCSCSVRLINNTIHYIAFKVKTTSPKKYCVRPNVGVIMPKSTRDFTVTMQAQRSAPPDMMCKDKFLIQSTIVSSETADDDITSSLFVKDDGKYVEETKLRVVLTSPPHSPVLSPMNGVLKQGPVYEAAVFKDHPSMAETLFSHKMAAKNIEEPNLVNDAGLKPAKEVELRPSQDAELKLRKDLDTPKDLDLEPAKDAVLNAMKDIELEPTRDGNMNMMNDVELNPRKEAADVEPERDANLKPANDFELPQTNTELKPAMRVELGMKEDMEDQKLVKEIEEMKSKLNLLESKLTEAEYTISKLTDERRLTIQERESIKEELARLKSKGYVKKVQVGFPFLYVCMVALVCVLLGYLLHR